MVSTQISDKVFKLTKKSNLDQALKILLPDYMQLKIFFLKQEIIRYEMKWNMKYEEFESKSIDMPDGFSYETEQEYYDWGEKVALLQHYLNLQEEWI